jgi:hypothetical protein
MSGIPVPSFGTAGSMVLSIAGGFLKSKYQKRLARTKARMIKQFADYNADVKDMEARSVLQTMGAETTRSYKQKRKSMAAQRATFAKTGATLSGTPSSVLLDQALEMQYDIANERRNRMLQAQTLTQTGKTTRYEGKLDAKSALLEGKAKAKDSLISGFTGAGISYFQGLN